MQWSVPQPRGCQFFDLPFELRLMIWKFALRPLDHNRPGAHFFSLVNRADGVEARRLSARCTIYADNNHCSGYHLAAPKFDSSDGSHSWTKNNPSAYTWDFGMWSACRESRQVIEAHYSQQDWTSGSRRGDWRRPYSQTSISLTASRNNNGWRFFLHPKQDLVCIQAFNPSVASWSDTYHRKDLCVASNHSGDLKVLSFGHIAITYDPSWNDFDEKKENFNFWHLYAEQSARGFFMRTLAFFDTHSHHDDGRKRRYLWLIDCNLKRVRYFNKNRKGRKVFYGNGQKFIEVEKSSSRRSFSSGEYSSVFDFLDKLNMLLEGDRPCHYMCHKSVTDKCSLCGGPSEYLTNYRIYDQVRVLMCEEST
ncbi:hypothetical protein J3E68DRAFT_384959 [Trichoderma sp. SZMC 28012]